MNLIEVKNLNVNFVLPDRLVMAVRNVSFQIEKGKTLGLVGESGCGKTVTAYSMLQLISPPGKIISGEIIYNDKNILTYDPAKMQKIRGKEISMIFQEPMTSLNPVFRIGYQISEVLKVHLGLNDKDAHTISCELLNKVGIPNPQKRFKSYPHELSGGMRQRVMIAMALAANPSLLIADEPTTALDVTIQAQILELLNSLQQSKQMSMLLITHDLGIVANNADCIAIMYAGEIVEYGNVAEIFSKPLHPYTEGLFASIPQLGEKKKRLHTIPGSVPTIISAPTGCVFHPRCPYGDKSCLDTPIQLRDIDGNRKLRCIKR